MSGKTPVSVLSGFLGAGKTTLLNHLLRNAGGVRYAVLVNDLGSVNIDASLVQNTVRSVGGAIGGIVELTSGCICCSIQDDLIDALESIHRELQPDHILIEATGAAEPKSILQTLYGQTLDGREPSGYLEVHNMVTLVDAAYFNTLLDSSRVVAKPRHWLLGGDRRRPLAELLMEQVECADVLVLNKCDLVGEKERDALAEQLGGLNPRAEVIRATEGQVEPGSLLGKRRFDLDETLAAARWRREIVAHLEGFSPSGEAPAAPLQPARPRSHADFGLGTLLYAARRPFRESAFLKLMRRGLPGVVRAKGFFWSDVQPDHVGLLSIAGGTLRADYLGRWWQVLIDEEEATSDDLPELVRNAWHPEFGDRRQELVFIGVDLDTDAIRRELDACLVAA